LIIRRTLENRGLGKVGVINFIDVVDILFFGDIALQGLQVHSSGLVNDEMLYGILFVEGYIL